MTRTKAAMRRHNNWSFWVLLAIFVWYAAPALHDHHEERGKASEVRQ